MTPEEQEAESIKYSSQVAMVLRLSTGAYAVFNAQRRLLCITDSMETVALAIHQAASTIQKPRAAALSLEDLGL
jgi:hypothetical protein